jgi:S1-C subfamily serine protease
MKNATRSHLAASVAGGLIVAGGMLAFGVTGRRQTQTIVEEAPVAVARVGDSSGLTPHSIYQREAPGVVYVTSRLLDPESTPFDVLHQAQTGTMTGSGFLIDRSGDVLTDYHLIEGASPSGISVRFEGGIQRLATVVAQAPGQDAALLRVNMRGTPAVDPLPLGDSASVRIGDPVLAIGDPYGLDRVLTTGIVSSLEHQLVAADGASVDNVIATDQPLEPAASGGPVLDAAGRVIGIASQLAGPGDTTLSFATPIDAVTPLLRGAHRSRAPQVAYIGLSGVTAGGSHPVVTITGVSRGGPAAQAGLRRGDAIDRMGGQTVSNPSILTRVLADHRPGAQLRIVISRAGRIRRLTVRLGSQP